MRCDIDSSNLIRMKYKSILDFMGHTHGSGISDNLHRFIQNGNWNLKSRISFFVYRHIFYVVDDHVVIMAAAPEDLGRGQTIFYDHGAGGVDGGPSGAAF